MQHLPRFLLVVLIFLAQAWAGAHAVEHAVGKEGVLPNHVCELCLATHDLGSALPSLLLPLPPVLVDGPVDLLPTPERSAFPAPLAHQRGPPAT